MAKQKKNTKVSKTISKNKKGLATKRPRCLPVAAKGIQTSQDFAQLMSCLMADVVEGNVSPGVANATCNAGGKLLKIVEMQIKYGTTAPGKPSKSINLLST